MREPAFLALDIAVLVAYLVGVVGLGCWFALRQRGADSFMTGERNLPAWVVGLSIFGTFVSSISFLAQPGKAYADNWNPFVFSLTLPIAAAISVRYFVPFYRKRAQVSAYEHLEHRFGPWARNYAAVFYILGQMGRTGTILYLLALPLHELLGWPIYLIVVVVGLATTVYTMLGGIEGVIWTDVVQSVVLIAGAALCVVLIPLQVVGGPGAVFEVGAEAGKFSLGTLTPSLTTSSFFVVFAYGLVINLTNFGIDQSYVQRYQTAKSDAAAGRSVWVGALSYIPVSAGFFFIGTALFVLYQSIPGELPDGISADRVFPYFMVTRLPVGCAGLLIAAVFAAAMSTVSSSLNCSATLTLTDFYKRYWRPKAGDRESLRVLHAATAAWGLIGIAVGLAMMDVKSALDIWWEIAGAFSGGMLGLFLLGYWARSAGSRAAAVATVASIGVIAWAAFSPRLMPEGAIGRNPCHPLLTIVLGTGTLLILGVGLSRVWPRTASVPSGG